jgi:hypothetical protein
MLSIGELSLFMPETLYVLPSDVVPQRQPIDIQEEPLPDEPETETTDIKPVLPKSIPLKDILFVSDVPLQGLALETFQNIIKALLLNEKDFTFLTQEEVFFDNLEFVSSKKIVLFGAAFTGFQTKYKLATAPEKIVLYADPMEKIADNTDLKRQLWTAPIHVS